MEHKARQTLGDAVVAITGCNRGIGHGMVRAFAPAGAKLVLHARTDAKLGPIVDEARQHGAEVVAVAGDLREGDIGERLIQAGVRCFGRVDALIMNAGLLGPMVPLAQTEPETFDRVMEVNVNACFRLARAAIGPMVERGRGVIVGLSSGLGRFALAGYGVYCVSKFALEGLMKMVAADYGESGITAMAVAPGMVRTAMLEAALGGGSDLSEYRDPDRVGLGFAALVADALANPREELSGASLNIDPWLPAER